MGRYISGFTRAKAATVDAFRARLPGPAGVVEGEEGEEEEALVPPPSPPVLVGLAFGGGGPLDACASVAGDDPPSTPP